MTAEKKSGTLSGAAFRFVVLRKNHFFLPPFFPLAGGFGTSLFISS